MLMNDPIADMLTRVRNALVARHSDVTLPSSNMKKAIAKIMLDEGYVKAVDYIDDGLQGQIKITLKYTEGKTSVINGLKRIFATAGEYQVKYQIGNANGVSLGMDSVSFKIDNTIFNFDQYFNLMAGGSEGSGSSKTWRIDNSVAQHLGCGPSGTTGTEWYGAQPDEKAGTGLYESSITLTTEKQYTFDPGKGGCVYVNTGCTIFPESHQDVDFSAPVEAQTVSYDFDVVGDNLYLTLPAETLFPYIANDAQYKSPVRFLIESVTPNLTTAEWIDVCRSRWCSSTTTARSHGTLS